MPDVHVHDMTLPAATITDLISQVTSQIASIRDGPSMDLGPTDLVEQAGRAARHARYVPGADIPLLLGGRRPVRSSWDVEDDDEEEEDKPDVEDEGEGGRGHPGANEALERWLVDSTLIELVTSAHPPPLLFDLPPFDSTARLRRRLRRTDPSERSRQSRWRRRRDRVRALRGLDESDPAAVVQSMVDEIEKALAERLDPNGVPKEDPPCKAPDWALCWELLGRLDRVIVSRDGERPDKGCYGEGYRAILVDGDACR
ncbi:uncharacterized protein SPPG_05988 [Spizellomyces punctatus DAOM BR117]|uniref:Uncharacterized protein n=1 Tax=Spizellomyces punctatus (strain DAOM BR117) TaxID=645134 RepID=A0A0L0HD24_SPIPD|nr:uncharacterized protein SPPG_05988 [Spizellomyces punctatus DAOM BR117]KNC99037.1 hypothetical protein SPPG_05988 [Spizellomyces punctatus DAOM BR117]|eukprot:XP_016607077.1 hypothetical protein SPPG_05988 [Spizellomyces punctatus DAOM BR117]